MKWGDHINTLKQRQNGRHFADDIFKYIILNENIWIAINISLKFVSEGHINNIPALFEIMAWRRHVIIRTNDVELTGAYMRHSTSVS